MRRARGTGPTLSPSDFSSAAEVAQPAETAGFPATPFVKPAVSARNLLEVGRQQLLPALDAFRPDFLLISAGFDAHKADPLANLQLEEADFAWATDQLLAVAAHRCQGRVVSTLEGGYNLAALAASSAAHVCRLMAASGSVSLA